MKNPMQWPAYDWEVRAVLEGRKTQHRIPVFPPPPSIMDGARVRASASFDCPHGVIGDRVYIEAAGLRADMQIADIRVERLYDLTEDDARAEGAMYHDGRGIGHSGWRHDYTDVHPDARTAYARIWGERHGVESIGANPWLYVIEFKCIETV